MHERSCRHMAIDAGQRVFGGRYEARRRVGSGGMAEVYLAHDQLLDREVAVKALNDQLARDPQFVERFRREARAAARLSHPNIVALHDYGATDDTYYICLLYTSDAADDLLCVDLGGRRIIKKKKKKKKKQS